MFHDHVKRSSRFTTTVPATEILERVANVVERRSSGSACLATALEHCVRVAWDEYRLEVLHKNVCVCTVQVYLLKHGLYMVDFQRGMMDVFDFKRFYEDLRQHLTEVVKHDYRLSALDVGLRGVG